MRITFVSPSPDLSGGNRVIAIYAEALSRMGHQVLVIHPAPRAPSLEGKIESLLRGRGWPRPPSAGPSHLDGRPIARRVVDPWRPVVDADLPDADLVIATWWETAEWVARLAPQKGTKIYFVQHHETMFPGQPLDRVEATYRLPLRKITIARWLVDLMRARYGDPDVALVPNGVDLDQFRAPPRKKQPTPTVGFMYSRIAFKGCDVTLRALQLARKSVADLSVVSFGLEPPEAVESLPPGTLFVASPPQDELRGLYARCDAWLFGSRSEGFGLPLLEAMACRTPIIATPTGAAPELVEAGGGFSVRMEDPADMSRAIVEICRMPNDEWEALSERAHGIASHHTWEVAAKLFEQALHAAVARP
jgi:glycosyltransferase involved in cell wall biosynthesis